MNRWYFRLCVLTLLVPGFLPAVAHAESPGCNRALVRHAEFQPIAHGYRILVVTDPAALAQGTALVPKNMRLLIGGHPIGGAPPQAAAEDPNVLRFDLLDTDADRTGYDAVSGKVTFMGGAPPVALGLVDITQPEAAQGASCGVPVRLAIVRSQGILIAGSAFLLAALVAFLWLAVKTDVVRDRNPLVLMKGERRPYSLSRCQMAFWFFVVVASYVFLVSVTLDFNGILNAQSLVLIGISSATWAAAATVDSNADPTGNPWPVHESFLTDLLTDRTGVTLHRFQMLIVTVLLGGIYLFSVGRNLAIPQFDNQLLGLIGISSGMYVGLKIPEKQS